jgi:hypothetical protein
MEGSPSIGAQRAAACDGKDGHQRGGGGRGKDHVVSLAHGRNAIDGESSDEDLGSKSNREDKTKEEEEEEEEEEGTVDRMFERNLAGLDDKTAGFSLNSCAGKGSVMGEVDGINSEVRKRGASKPRPIGKAYSFDEDEDDVENGDDDEECGFEEDQHEDEQDHEEEKLYDAYGFSIEGPWGVAARDSSGESVPSAPIMLKGETERGHGRAWDKYTEQLGERGDVSRTRELMGLVRSGIPSAFRGRMWFSLSRCGELKAKHPATYYVDMIGSDDFKQATKVVSSHAVLRFDR